MSKLCVNCRTELAEGALFCPACGKAQSGMPRQIISVPIKKGPLVLPETPLSLWAAILVMIGTAGYFCNWLTFVIEYKVPGTFIWLMEVILLLGAAIVLLISRKKGIPLFIPFLIWSAGTLFIMIDNLQSAINIFTKNYDYRFYPFIYLLYGLLSAAAAVILILYSFKMLKRKPSAVTVGLLMALLFITGITFNTFNFVSLLNHNSGTGIVLRVVFIILYYLTVAPGIFLTVLAAKEKQATIIDESIGK